MRVAACGLIALVFVLYYPALSTQLVSDDFSLVGQIGFAEASSYFTSTFGFGRNEYRPFTALTYALDHFVWGDRPEGYHLTNLALHAAAAVLFFYVLHALTADFALALIAAALFVIHPINHSRVAWISARDASVCAVFLLGAIASFIVHCKQQRRFYRWVAAMLAVGAMLAYEGAVVLPALLSAIFLLFFSSGGWRSRLWESARAAAPYWGVLAGYVCLWQLLFSGQIGSYALTGMGGMAENYGRLLYTLFYGHRRVVFGAAYVVLLVISCRTLLDRWRIVALSVAFVLLSFAPYAMLDGFAYRFGYFSAMGFCVLLAAVVLSGARSAIRPRQAATVALGLTLGIYYVVEVRKILADWEAAGQIAVRVPRAVRELYPAPRPGAVLVFTGVPHMYGKAQLFSTGLEAAIQRQFSVNVTVRQYEAPSDAVREAMLGGARLFHYRGGDDPLLEVTANNVSLQPVSRLP